MNTPQLRRVLFVCPPGTTRDQLWPPAVQQTARDLGFDVSIYPPGTDPAGFSQQLAGIEALLTTWGSPRLTNAVLGSSKLRIVGHAAGSVAGIVSPDLYDRGIRVVTANPVMAHVVAEYSLMVTLIARTHLTAYAQIGRQPLNWQHDCARQVHGSTIGIWGYGDVARRLIQMLQPLRPGKILVHSAALSDVKAAELGVTKARFDELFAQADVLHLLDALTPPDKHRVGAAQLAALRDGATLVNAGRADLVEPNALLAALKQNRFTAFLDVHYQEPLPATSPFRALPNVVLTPHAAGFAGRERYVPFVLQELSRFFAGEPLQAEITHERAAPL